jgi:nucleotide-binding universal stress UspA family protein
MYHSLLIPLDGSPTGEQALESACTIAERTGATLHLVHVHTLYDSVYVDGMPVIDDQLRSLGREHERAYLAKVHDRLLSKGVYNITFANPECDETVVNTLLTYMHNQGNDLIVMSSHGRGGFARFWLGSNADLLIRASRMPVLLVRSSEDSPAGQLTKEGVIVLPLDGSALAEQIIEPAFGLGSLLNSRYLVLRVVRPALMLHGPVPYAEAVDFDPGKTERERVEAQRYLDAVAERLQALGAQVKTELVIAIQPAQAILEVAQREQALIALATHGESGLQRLVLGSVADKVVRGSSLPVLVYRPN